MFECGGDGLFVIMVRVYGQDVSPLQGFPSPSPLTCTPLLGRQVGGRYNRGGRAKKFFGKEANIFLSGVACIECFPPMGSGRCNTGAVFVGLRVPVPKGAQLAVLEPKVPFKTEK